jgi:hypothetical protein
LHVRFCGNKPSLAHQTEDKGKVEYRVWNPFRSKIAAAILGGVEEIHVKPGAKVWQSMRPSCVICVLCMLLCS